MASLHEDREQLAAAIDDLKATVLREVYKNWPWLIVLALVFSALVLLVNWFVTGNIFS